MDIDLRLPSGDQKEDFDSNGVEGILVETKPHSSEEEIENNCEAISLVEEADCRVVELYREDGALEPLSGMEFESHGAAYAFYQEYARSVGFNTAIQNSRRSKTSKEFIDAKFACSRYGTKREYDKSMNRPRARQAKHDPETASGRRSISKTDCKASMHVKRRPDGKWVIHSFVKDHNHELLPAQAVSEQTRKIYAAMARQFAEYKNVVGLKNDSKSVFEKGRHAFDLGDCRMVLEFLTSMQSVNSNFFYAVDLGEDQSVKNLLWVDAKSRNDYANFYDVVSFDTNYIRSKYKIPLAIFVGVNQHYQFMLLGCALLSDDSEGTYSWLMSTWVRAMGGLPPKVLITEQDKSMKYVVSEVFPTTLHCYFLWNVIGKVTESLGHVLKQHGNFMEKFEKCVFRSSNEDEFAKRWYKILERFDLKENELMESLFEDREHWVPAYRRGTLLAGMCTVDRSDSVNSYFDKYIHKKTTLHEFAKQYEAIILDRYDEEGKADSDTWNKAPVLKSPSPLEKSVSGAYTHAVFKKFQVEVLGVVACHPKAEIQDDTFVSFRVQDLEKQQDFSVTWNQLRCEVCCICRLFEYRGYLCRHALVVLQMCQQSSIPSHYVLKRWTKDAKNRNFFNGDCGQPSSRVQRYNELCHRALKLCEESSLSLESFTLALRSMEEVYGSCVSMNNSYKNVLENVASSGRCILAIDDDNQNRIASKPTKKKAPTKRRKVTSEDDVAPVGTEDSLQQMDKLNGFFGTQPSVSGMLNLMGPTRDAFYGDQQAIQGLGHLNTISTGHDGYYASHQTMSGLGQMDFFRSQTNFAYGIRDDGHVRTGQSHENASRHS